MFPIASVGAAAAAVPETRPAGGGRSHARALLLGRAIPASLFAVLAWLVLQHLVASIARLGDHPSWVEWATGPVRTLIYFFFCAIPIALILARSSPIAQDGAPAVRIAAVTGTVMLLAAANLLPAEPRLYVMPAWGAGVATLLLLVMQALALYGLLSLRTSFSIIPEARRLVHGGPYRYVRHPLYSAEIGAAVAVILPAPTPWSVALVGCFVAVQVYRARREEAVLQRAFPQYAAYRHRTAALIPFVW